MTGNMLGPFDLGLTVGYQTPWGRAAGAFAGALGPFLWLGGARGEGRARGLPYGGPVGAGSGSKGLTGLAVLFFAS
jgi:hypothetical protein